MVSLHSHKNLTNIHVHCKDWDTVVTELIMLLLEALWILEFWIWEVIEHFKWSLMGDPSRKLEEIYAEGDFKGWCLF